MSESQILVAAGRPMLEYLPVSLFGSVLGLTGLSVAWRLAHARYGASEWMALAIAALLDRTVLGACNGGACHPEQLRSIRWNNLATERFRPIHLGIYNRRERRLISADEHVVEEPSPDRERRRLSALGRTFNQNTRPPSNGPRGLHAFPVASRSQPGVIFQKLPIRPPVAGVTPNVDHDIALA